MGEQGGAAGAGQVLDGKYRLDKKLGEGGMGVVWLAEHIALRKRIAVKTLRPEIAALPDIAARFATEARAASAIEHANVVRVSDFGTNVDGTLYLVMELLDGRSLADELAERGRLGRTRSLHIVVEMLRGLGAAHAAGVVHRDLKPENVFLSHGSEGEVIKVVDFGLARLVTDADVRLTATGSVMGTPLYMSPEQARGVRDVDPRADLYAAGVMLYEMLAGRTPYSGETFAEVAHALLEARPRPLAELAPEVEPALAAAVMKAMAPDREARFANAAEMREALQRLMPGPLALGGTLQPISASMLVDLPRGKDAPTVPETAQALGGQHRAAVGPPPVDLDSETIAPRPPQPKPRSDQPEIASQAEGPPVELVRRPTVALGGSAPSPLTAAEAPPSRRLGLVIAVVAALLAAGGAGVWWLRSQPPSTVRIQVALPRGARMYVDGTEVHPPFNMRGDKHPHAVRVERAGRQPRILLLTPDQDQTFDID